MIVFNNWQISCTGVIAQQYDNLTRKVEIVGELPEGYEWSLLVECGENKDTLHLERTAAGAEVVLTQDNLSVSGYYKLQLRGNLAEDTSKTRHTNPVQTFVPASLSGVGQWPEMPSEFAQIEQRLLELNAHAQSSEQGAKDAAASAKTYSEQAQAVAGNIPYVGENGNWFIGGEDSGVPATGDSGFSIYYSHITDWHGEVGTSHRITLEDVQAYGKELQKGDIIVTLRGNGDIAFYAVVSNRVDTDGWIIRCLAIVASSYSIYFCTKTVFAGVGANDYVPVDTIRLGKAPLKEGDLIITANARLALVTGIGTDYLGTQVAGCEILGCWSDNVLTSPDGTQWQLTVDNSGNLTTTKLS